MSSGRNGQGSSACRRSIVAAAATVGSFFAIAGVAHAATFFVEGSGADVGTCMVDPCLTIDYAIGQARAVPGPDTIEVGAGDYAQSVDATHPDDDGLTIRGELGGGAPATTISGDAAGSGGCAGSCIVALGRTPATNVTLENVDVTQTTADPAADLSPIHMDGGSDLATVGVFVTDPETFAGVELCSDPGSAIDDSFIDATGTSARGIDGCGDIDVVDSGVFVDEGPALAGLSNPGETSEITRSWLSTAEGSAEDSASLDGNVTVDSSLITGGVTALDHLGANESDILVNNSTLDAGVPGQDDGQSVFLHRTGSDPIDALVDSSILVDQVRPDFGSAPLVLTCDYTNFIDFSNPGDPGFTNDCPNISDPGTTNTSFSSAAMFVGSTGPFYDWSLRSGSPSIDAGQPGPVPPGLSGTDILGDPRRLPGTTATCPDGVRDQGAFEAAAVSCGSPPPPQQRTLTVSTAGTGSGAVTGPGINCGAGNTDCSETVAQGASIALTADPADGSSFDGFFGGGCSASPCTVTMGSNTSVQASFTNTRSDQRALVVETSGTGTGTITGPGIDCGGGEDHTDCTESYPVGERVELRAEAGENSIFRRFTGAGCDADPCTVTMDATRAVVGRFMNARIPRIRFARRPHGKTRNPVFRMRSSQPRSTFECRLDKGEWEECEKRVQLRGLDRGRHTFRARATTRFDVTGPARKARFRVRRR